MRRDAEEQALRLHKELWPEQGFCPKGSTRSSITYLHILLSEYLQALGVVNSGSVQSELLLMNRSSVDTQTLRSLV